ncbi:TPA: glycosyltransferase family 2 protein [Streptococcus suis]
MDAVKVSVIIPTYKRSEAICRAVDSVLAQTLESVQIIVVDDNGVDTDTGRATAEVMKKYANEPKVLYLQHDVNKNGSAARNTGIRAAKGEYIAFLDDDDIYLPKRLEKMSKKLDSLDNSWGACYTGYVKHQKDGSKQYSAENNEGDLYLQTLMRSFYIGSGANLFFRKTVVDDIGMFDESFRRNQDLEYLVRVLKKYKMAYVDDVLMEVFYDVSPSKITFEQSREREQTFREKFGKHLNELDAKSKKEVQIMWDIDWLRVLISRKKIALGIKTFLGSHIPLTVLVKYICYAINRKKNNTSYGFVVKI